VRQECGVVRRKKGPAHVRERIEAYRCCASETQRLWLLSWSRSVALTADFSVSSGCLEPEAVWCSWKISAPPISSALKQYGHCDGDPLDLLTVCCNWKAPWRRSGWYYAPGIP